MTTHTHTPGPRLYPYQWRTFGDVARHGIFTRGTYQTCRFCKGSGIPLEAYGLRQNICQPCAQGRADEVLPRVKKREKWEARRAEILAQEPAAIAKARGQ
jgi:hypothetical protein